MECALLEDRYPHWLQPTHGIKKLSPQFCQFVMQKMLPKELIDLAMLVMKVPILFGLRLARLIDEEPRIIARFPQGHPAYAFPINYTGHYASTVNQNIVAGDVIVA